MKLMAGIDIKTMLASLAVFAVMAASLMGIIAVSKDIKEDQAAAISKNIKTILVLTLMFKLLASTLKKLAAIDIASLWSAVGVLTVMAAVMIGSLAVINALSKAQKSQRQTSAFTKTLSGMIVLIAAMAGLCYVIKNLASVDQGSLWSAVGVMAAMSAVIVALIAVISILAEVTGGSSGMLIILIGLSTTMLTMAASMLVMVASMSLLTDVLTRMADVQWTSILKMAAALGTFMVVGALGGVVAVPLLALAAAIALLGAGMLMAGYGAQLLNNNIVGCMENLAKALGEMIPTFVASLIDGFASLSATILNAATELMSSLLDMIIELGPKMMTAFVSILTVIKDGLDSAKAIIVESLTILGEIIVTVLVGLVPIIAKGLGDILSQLIMIIHDNKDTIKSNLRNLVTDLLDILSVLIVDGLPALAEDLFLAVNNLLDVFNKYAFKIAAKIAGGILTAIASALIIATASLSSLAGIMIRFLAGIIVLTVQVAKGLGHTLYEAFKTIFWNAVDIAGDVIHNALTNLPTVFLAIGSKIMQAIIDSFRTIIENNAFFKAIFDFFGWTGKLKAASDSLASTYDNLIDETVLNGDNVIAAASEASANIKKTMHNTVTGITDDVCDAMSSINDAISDMTDVLTGTGDSDNDITLTVGLDTTSAQNSLSDLTGSISNTSGTVYGSNAYAASSGTTANGGNSKTVNTDNSVTYNNTFNITGSDAQEIGTDVNTTLQRQVVRQRATKGAI